MESPVSSPTKELEDECVSRGVARLLAACASASPSVEQHSAARDLNAGWMGGQATTHAALRCLSAPRGDDADPLAIVLRAMDNCCDDLAMLLLCRLLEGFLAQSKGTARQRRVARLLRADAVSAVCRALRARLRDDAGLSTKADRPLQPVALDALAALLMLVGTKDRRMCLKLRMCGVLPPICERMCDGTASPTLLRLLCRAVRSPRNAQLMGRQKDVPRRLIARVHPGSDATRSMSSLQLLLRARHLEILYFVSKNKKTRGQLIAAGCVAAVLRLLQESIWCMQSLARGSPESAAHTEAALVATAQLRILANTKKGKEELLSCGTLEMCERAIRELSSDGGKDKDKSPRAQLQDSLCALCVRCLPVSVFPVTAPYPLRLALPKSATRAASAGAAPGKRLKEREREPAGRSPVKLRPRVPSASLGGAGKRERKKSVREKKGRKEEDEEGEVREAEGSSDQEDEEQLEEEDVCVLGVLDREDGADPDDSMRAVGSDDDDDGHGDGSNEAKSPSEPQFSSQRMSELNSNYAHCFVEQSEGARGRVPPAARKTHADRIRAATQTTSSVMKFVKIAYPELADPNVDLPPQPLVRNSDSMKEMVVQEMARARLRAPFQHRVVYDVDGLLAESHASRPPTALLGNNDVQRLGVMEQADHLLFESRFESGNLRRATQVGPTHYELVLSPDINQHRDHYQWFYFEVSNNKPNVAYTFEIINCLKTTSMYSNGMQPVMYSVAESVAGKGGWVRAGQSVCYYGNMYTRGEGAAGGAGGEEKPTSKRSKLNAKQKVLKVLRKDHENVERRRFFSIRFSLTFRHKADVCYLAYHYPYTYSYLNATLESLISRSARGAVVRSDVYGKSLAGNPLHILTVTAEGTEQHVASRPLVILSARVHPGESNASWMMHGVLETLISNTDPVAVKLRESFVFKLLPMLNVDGVVSGSHRCSLAGVDLNRVWQRPSRHIHPEIWHAKGVVQYVAERLSRQPLCVVDLHGHSRRAGVFIFGNNPEESWREADRKTAGGGGWQLLPEILAQTAPAFSLKNCRYAISKCKESSARIALWRQFGIQKCYTMESTYCGCEEGAYEGLQMDTRALKEMGRRLAEAMLELHRRDSKGVSVSRGKSGRVSDAFDRENGE